MLPYLILLVRFFEVLAVTSSYNQDSNTTLSLDLQDGNSVCSMKPVDEVSYLKPWREISQRAQGCSVPYFGPQGHGQNPEEVHIVHITEIGRLIQTLPNQHGVIAAISVKLDSASCGNKTIRLISQTSLQHTKPEGNETNPSETDEERSMANKKGLKAILKSKSFSSDQSNPTGSSGNHYNENKNFPAILRSQNFAVGLSAEHFATRRKRDMGLYATTSHTSPDPATNVKRPLVLLLTSDRPVMWQIMPGICWTQEMASRIQVLVERDSLVDSDIHLEVVEKTWAKRINRKSIQRYARRTFHGIASFTQIRGANSVRISVGPDGSTYEESSQQLSFHTRNKLNFCDFSSRQDSNLVSASLSVPLSSENCVVGNGHLMKSFIVEVKLPTLFSQEVQDTKNPSISKPKKEFLKNLPSIFVQLTENKSKTKLESIDETFATRPYIENVTVVLKSREPCQWILSSSVIHSNIHVVTNEGDVTEFISNSGGSLELSSVLLPQSRDELIQKTSSEYGSPVHYFQVSHATGFTLTVDDPNQVQTIGKFHQQLPPPNMQLPPWSIKLQSSIHPPVDFRGASRNSNVLSVLESDMGFVCGESMFEIVLPAPILIEIGVKSLHLKDKSCQSHSNGTHFIVASLLQSCGSDVHTDGKNSVISNTVYADFEDGDINWGGSNDNQNITQELIGVPVSCRIMPALNENIVRSIFNSRGDVASKEEDVVKNLSQNSDISSSIYQLELYQRNVHSEGSLPIKYNSVFSVNDQLYVRIWMNDAPSAQAVAENCWLSNLPHSFDWIPNQQKVLISGMCPVEKSVRLEIQSPKIFPLQEKSFMFSFQILEDFLHLGGELYIHCQIGVCMSSLKHSKGKPILCVDAQDYCLHRTRLEPSSKVFSTAHQLLTRGPITITSPSDQTNQLNSVLLETKCTGESALLSSSSVSMDMIVAIAVCSFIIGVGLTATLWFIHNKTDPTHQHCHAREYSLGSRSAVMGLSPHSGCSSANSQSAIA